MIQAPAPIDVLPSIRDAMGGMRAWNEAKTAEEDVWRSAVGQGVDLTDKATYAEVRSKAAAAASSACGGSHLTSAKTGLPIELVVDGGVQRGTDILKGLAMGADAVAIGKPYLYGLCAGGEEGAAKAIEVLSVELERAMGLLGVGTVRELRARMAAGEELVRRRQLSPRDFPDRGALDRGYGGGVF